MTSIAATTWLTPFGVPFDSGVIIGLVLTVLSIVLAGTRRAHHTGEQEGGEQR